MPARHNWHILHIQTSRWDADLANEWWGCSLWGDYSALTTASQLSLLPKHISSRRQARGRLREADLGLVGVILCERGRGGEAPGASEFWLSYLSSWAQAHPSLSCFVCTNMIVCSQADCYIHVYTHTHTRVRARTYTQTNTRVPWLSLCVTLHTWPTGLLWLSARDEPLNKSGKTLTSKYTCFLSFPNSRKVSTLS